MSSGKRSRTAVTGIALVTGALACALGAVAASPAAAKADPISELQAAQQQVSQANEDYAAATERVEELEGLIAENEARIAELEAELPELREQAASSMRTLYKLQQGSGGLLELLLSSDDFYGLIATVQYLDTIQSRSTDAVDELLSSVDEIAIAQATLNNQLEEAEAQAQAAEEALSQANAARTALQEQIEAQAAAEEAERQAAIQAAQDRRDEAEQNGGDASFTTESGNEAEVETPSDSGSSGSGSGSGSGSSGSSGSAGSVDWSSDKASFVSEWTARINAFLAGSPLAGYGSVFAEAAWEYGVDPRFSPAISQVESGRGAYCFLPHNAWGWGSASWSSWEQAIWSHVSGLASLYGGQLTYAGACMYCPPNADLWYSSVLANMQSM